MDTVLKKLNLGGLTEKFEAEHITQVQKMEILGVKSSSDMMS